jgi:hypothetical protein
MGQCSASLLIKRVVNVSNSAEAKMTNPMSERWIAQRSAYTRMRLVVQPALQNDGNYYKPLETVRGGENEV